MAWCPCWLLTQFTDYMYGLDQWLFNIYTLENWSLMGYTVHMQQIKIIGTIAQSVKGQKNNNPRTKVQYSIFKKFDSDVSIRNFLYCIFILGFVCLLPFLFFQATCLIMCVCICVCKYIYALVSVSSYMRCVCVCCRVCFFAITNYKQ